MALPNVTINLQNGTLGGLLQTSDGVCGLVLTGTTEGSVTAGTPFLIRSYTAAINLGLTETNNAFALKQVREYYSESGEGAELYLMLVPDTMLASQMADVNNANGAKKLLDYAGRKVRYIGLLRDTFGKTITVTNGMDNDLPGASVAAQLLATTYAANPHQYPFRVVLGAQKYSGDATQLVDGNTLSQNRVAIVVGDTVNGEGAAVGLYLGRRSKSPVQRKSSRVRTGALNVTTAYIGAVLAEQYTNTDIVHDKQFITFRTFPNKTGYFFTGDPARTATTDDYALVPRGAVIDKAQILAYATYVNEVDEEIPIGVDGKMEAGYCKSLEQAIINQINGIMTANREISGVECYVDPNQNVLSNNTVNIVLRITPVGYASTIVVALGFYNPALNS